MPRAIPHSVFLSWDADDRDKALWWLIHQRRTCPTCGTRPEEWDEDQGGDLHAYVSEPRHCRGCEVLAQGEDWFEQNRKQLRRGTTMRLMPSRQSGADEPE